MQRPSLASRGSRAWLTRLLALHCALLSSLVHAQPGEPAVAGPELRCASPRECVDRAAQAYLSEGAASAVQLAIWRDGRFVYSGALGFTGPDRATPVTRHSLFQIGSNGKKATALALLRAVEAGRVRLDDPVDRALPLFALARAPAWARRATVRDLLTHQSGLWDHAAANDAPDDRKLQQTVWGAFARNERVTTPPGVAYSYANPNYSLIGAMLEHAYGRSYPDVMQREVYDRLHMRQTYARRDDAVATGRAVWGFGVGRNRTSDSGGFDVMTALESPPWRMEPEWVEPGENVDNAYTRPAGLTWSTAEDECRVGAFLLDGKRGYLSEESRAAMVTPETEIIPGEANLGYAFGLNIGRGLSLGPDEWYDVPAWMHTGSTTTMSSMFFVLPEQRLVVSVLHNALDGPPSFLTLISTIFRQYARLPPKQTPPPAVPPDSGSRYAGTYTDPEGLGTITLRWDGMSLLVSAPEIEARGITVEPTALIERPGVLVLGLNGQPVRLTVWPSTSYASTYLVGRETAFVRASP